jgi:uncharacterized protein
MSELKHIPLFPLSLLPFPGELVPLHIFEPRYRQLLEDAEKLDVRFGIYCAHELNKEKLGSVMKLESIVKRYPSGESDIVVRCIDNFALDQMFRNFKDKLYPGGQVLVWETDENQMPSAELYEMFIEYQKGRNIKNHMVTFTLFQIAIELNLDLFDRYKFLTCDFGKRLSFLLNQLKFQLHVIREEQRSKDLYHLN